MTADARLARMFNHVADEEILNNVQTVVSGGPV